MEREPSLQTRNPYDRVRVTLFTFAPDILPEDAEVHADTCSVSIQVPETGDNGFEFPTALFALLEILKYGLGWPFYLQKWLEPELPTSGIHWLWYIPLWYIPHQSK